VAQEAADVLDVVFPWHEIRSTPRRETHDLVRLFVGEIYWSTKRRSQQIPKPG
jgi:CRISPR/Cas system endoribonuclease Cas6 (RAMP superfamily)